MATNPNNLGANASEVNPSSSGGGGVGSSNGGLNAQGGLVGSSAMSRGETIGASNMSNLMSKQ
jgi:hypothetical protein